MAGSDTVRLVDDQTFEMLDRHSLEPMELAVSISSMAFAEDSAVYFVVGTAFTEPDEAESKKVRSSCPAELHKAPPRSNAMLCAVAFVQEVAQGALLDCDAAPALCSSNVCTESCHGVLMPWCITVPCKKSAVT